MRLSIKHIPGITFMIDHVEINSFLYAFYFFTFIVTLYIILETDTCIYCIKFIIVRVCSSRVRLETSCIFALLYGMFAPITQILYTGKSTSGGIHVKIFT